MCSHHHHQQQQQNSHTEGRSRLCAESQKPKVYILPTHRVPHACIRAPRRRRVESAPVRFFSLSETKHKHTLARLLQHGSLYRSLPLLLLPPRYTPYILLRMLLPAIPLFPTPLLLRIRVADGIESVFHGKKDHVQFREACERERKRESDREQTINRSADCNG